MPGGYVGIPADSRRGGGRAGRSGDDLVCVKTRNFRGNDAAQPSRARIFSLSSITEPEIPAFSARFVKGPEFSHSQDPKAKFAMPLTHDKNPLQMHRGELELAKSRCHASARAIFL